MFFKVVLEEISNFFKKIVQNTHKEGYVYIVLSFVIFIFASLLSGFLGFLMFLILCWCIYFFRDPERVTNTSEDIISSPADGIVVDVSKHVPPVDSGVNEEMQKISIFLNVFDVHVNRSPVSGIIEKIIYHKGKFLNASVDKASEENERNTLVIGTSFGKVVVIQIAGLIARRIICNASANQNIKSGERYGIIKFGSRVDLYIPLSFNVRVIKGQRMIGGETIIAEK